MVGRAPEGSRSVCVDPTDPSHPPRDPSSWYKSNCGFENSSIVQKVRDPGRPDPGARLASLTRGVERVFLFFFIFIFSRFRDFQFSLLFHLTHEDGALDHLRPPRRGDDDPDDGV